MTINNSGEYNSAQLDHEQISEQLAQMLEDGAGGCGYTDVEFAAEIDTLKCELKCIEMEIEDYDNRMEARFQNGFGD